MNRYLLSLLVPCLLASSSGRSEQEWVDRDAKRILDEKSEGKRVDPEKWGMTQITMLPVYNLDVGSSHCDPVPDHPGRFKVTLPIWCEGTDLNGQLVKRQMKAEMIMQGGILLDYQFVEQSRLTFFHQTVALLIYSYGLPFLLILLLIFFFSLDLGDLTKGCLPVFLLLTLVMAGIAGYYCFF